MDRKVLMTGNEAIGEAAIQAGCDFYAGYPITPSSEIITYCGSVGTLSGLGYYALKLIGMPNVKLYVRSFKEWKSLEKPTASQKDANYCDLSAE